MEWESQRPSAPSTPSSLSSQSTGNSGTRPEKIPTLIQISPSPSVSALSKLSDDDLRRKGQEDLIRILRRIEADYKSLLGEHGNIVKDVNRRFQIFVLETRSLKEVNQKLQDDNQELRDLCCFLDDDRQRGRKLAREWQRFGRYTASVMRSEVSVYQEKLRELEERQSELINENMDLKELCLFLDQERVRMTGDRDEGDGSSNGTVTGQEDGIALMETNGSITPTPNITAPNNYPVTPSSAATYIRELELKVHRLEEEKRLLAQRVDRNSAEGHDVLPSLMDGTVEGAGNMSLLGPGSGQSVHVSIPGTLGLRKSPVSSKPEAVVHAMKVLQVHEEIEKTPTEDEDLDDPEKAIVREMCNVVWRKLGDVGDVGSFNESSDSILDPPFVPDSPDKLTNLRGGGGGPPFVQGQAHSQSVTQPQPRMASTPILASEKSNLGNQYVANTADQLPGNLPLYQYHPQRQERHQPLRPPQESNQLPLNTNPSGLTDSGMTNRQNSLSEKLTSEKDRNFPSRQHADRSEDRKNQEHNPNFVLDTNIRPAQQHQPSAHQRQSPSSSHQPSQSLSEVSSHPVSSHQPSDAALRISSLPSHYQRQPPLHHPPPVMPKNSNQPPISGHVHSQLSESGTVTPHSQQQRNPQANLQQPVKLLDAPGAHNYRGNDSAEQQFQRLVPSQQGPEKKRDIGKGEPSSHAPVRPHSRGEGLYEDRSSSERDSQIRSAPRSLSSFSAPNQSDQNKGQHPVPLSQQAIHAPGVFRAYPPQLTSMPTQRVSWWGPGGQNPSVSNKSYPQDPTVRTNPHQTESATRQNFNSGPTVVQSRVNTAGKRALEQEWRQTYLDDSDTL